MKTTVYLIRHSEQLKNKADINCLEDSQIGNEKIILTVNGEKKAEKLAKELYSKTSIDVLYTSHYVRAMSTAKYIAYIYNLPMNVDYRLGERKLGDLNLLRKLGEGKKYGYTTCQMLDENFKNIGSESMLEVRERALNFLEEVLKENRGKNICLVTHGALIKFLLLNYCTLNKETLEICFNGNKIVGEKLSLPDLIKVIYEDNKLIDIQHMES